MPSWTCIEMKIEEAILYVLVERNGGLRTEQIAEIINRRKLHIRKDGNPVTSAQVYAVVMRYPDTFVKSEGRIMLMIWFLLANWDRDKYLARIALKHNSVLKRPFCGTNRIERRGRYGEGGLCGTHRLGTPDSQSAAYIVQWQEPSGNRPDQGVELAGKLYKFAFLCLIAQMCAVIGYSGTKALIWQKSWWEDVQWEDVAEELNVKMISEI